MSNVQRNDWKKLKHGPLLLTRTKPFKKPLNGNWRTWRRIWMTRKKNDEMPLKSLFFSNPRTFKVNKSRIRTLELEHETAARQVQHLEKDKTVMEEKLAEMMEKYKTVKQELDNTLKSLEDL